MIVVSVTITADNTDALGSTDLANIPADGQLDIYIASTQNDTVFSFTGPGNDPITRLQKVMQRTNGMPSLKDDVPFSAAVVQGGHYVLNIDIVTAATVNFHAIFRELAELA